MKRCRLLGVFCAALAGACGGDGSQPTSATSVPTPSPTPAASRALYRLSFEASWSAQSHATDFPRNAHFSPLVGATHSARVSFWGPGQLASEGMEAMAERGRTTPLDSEIGAAISAGGAATLIAGSALDATPDAVALEFEVQREFSLVTLVTMVAPSPDWFVGVHDVNLVEQGDWVGDKTVTLYPWDAGTDDGVSYESPDADTQPRQPIRLLQGPPVAQGGAVAPFGVFRFTRLQ